MARAPRSRVVVTGIGIISSIGIGRAAFAQALREGRSAVSAIRSFDTQGYPYAHATEVHELGTTAPDYAELIGRMGRASAFAVLAAREAVQDSRLTADDLRAANAGVAMGSTSGESRLSETIMEQSMRERAHEVSVQEWEMSPAHRVAEAVAADHRLPAGGMVLATACAAGNYAIGAATDAIHDGESEVMLCGGVDVVCRRVYSGFFCLGAITPDVCRPFDAGRRGIPTGEGAAVLVLESMKHALTRGAPIWGEVLGYASNCDAKNMVAPDRASIAQCIRRSHERASVRAEDVGYVCAHGTGTRANDLAEAGALCDVFGEATPPASSIKSMLGHTMGAASAMGAVACLVGMREGFMPPTINFEKADPGCDIDCIPNAARMAHYDVAENHGFAFGGNNAILVLGRAPAEAP